MGEKEKEKEEPMNQDTLTSLEQEVKLINCGRVSEKIKKMSKEERGGGAKNCM